MPNHIMLARLAKELDIDRSSLRKAVIKMGIPMFKVRSRLTRGQPGLAVTPENADAIRQHYSWKFE